VTLTPSSPAAPARRGDWDVKAYSSKANWALLRTWKRRSRPSFLNPRDQITNRKRKGHRGSHPVDFDSEAYRRSVAEQSCTVFKQWRSIATRYAKLTITHRSM
jgi:hypothetical protein